MRDRDVSRVEEGIYKGEPVRIARATRVLADPAVSGQAYVIVAQTNEARSALTREFDAARDDPCPRHEPSGFRRRHARHSLCACSRWNGWAPPCAVATRMI